MCLQAGEEGKACTLVLTRDPDGKGREVTRGYALAGVLFSRSKGKVS